MSRIIAALSICVVLPVTLLLTSCSGPPEVAAVETSIVQTSEAPDATPVAPVVSHEDAVAALEIKAGQEPDEIAKALVDRISKWCMAGSDEATAEKMLGLGYAPNDRKIYTDKLAAEQKEIYAEAIFGKNWQDNDDVREFVLKQEKVNAGVLLRYIITSNDAVPFTEAVALENYAFLSGDSMNGKFVIDSIVHENTDSIPKLIKLGFPNDNDGLFTLTVNYQTADEKIIISSIG